MSETVTVDVKLRPGEALTKALERMKGSIIGQGTHEFFNNSVHHNAPVVGYGFTLPGWSYPLVIDDKGSLHFDDYKGSWGDREQLNELQQEYALQVAQAQAEAMGLYCERHEDLCVVVHFGEGRTITVDYSGAIDANGFNGVGCDTACEQFAAALGQTLNVSHKQEYFEERAKVSERG